MKTLANSPRELKRLSALAMVAIALTLLTGGVYGHWTQRWGPPPDLRTAADWLATLPHQIGDWRMLEELTLADEVTQTLECAGYVNRIYVHVNTGNQINIAIVVGPPGPTSVHTPEICYSSRAYEIVGTRERQQFHSSGGPTHSLWSTFFKSRNAGSDTLEVYYGWSYGERWIASKSPRFEFGGRSVLYKIQLASLINSVGSDNLKNPCQNFIDSLLTSFWKPPEA